MHPGDTVIFQYGEREFSLADAELRVQTAMAELGLTAQLECFGGDPPMWRWQLVDDAGAPPLHGLGSGKGSTEGARIGSMYEALEHLLTQSPDWSSNHRYCAPAAKSRVLR